MNKVMTGRSVNQKTLAAIDQKTLEAAPLAVDALVEVIQSSDSDKDVIAAAKAVLSGVESIRKTQDASSEGFSFEDLEDRIAQARGLIESSEGREIKGGKAKGLTH